MGGFTLIPKIGSLEEPCLPYYAVLMIVIVQSRNMTGSRGPSRLSDRLFVAAFFSQNIWALVCVCVWRVKEWWVNFRLKRTAVSCIMWG